VVLIDLEWLCDCPWHWSNRI